MKCISCHAEIENAKFCPYCGTRQPVQEQKAEVKEEEKEPVAVETTAAQETEKKEEPVSEVTKEPENAPEEKKETEAAPSEETHEEKKEKPVKEETPKVVVETEVKAQPSAPRMTPEQKEEIKKSIVEYLKNPFANTPLNGVVSLIILVVGMLANAGVIYSMLLSITKAVVGGMNSMMGGMYSYDSYDAMGNVMQYTGTSTSMFVLTGIILTLGTFAFFFLEDVLLNHKEAKDSFGRAAGKLLVPTLFDLLACVGFMMGIRIGFLFVILSTLTEILAVTRIGKKSQNGYFSIFISCLYIVFITLVLGIVVKL